MIAIGPARRTSSSSMKPSPRATSAAKIPVGKTFTIVGSGAANSNRVVEVVGMVANTKYQRLREAPRPIMYAAFNQQPQRFSSAQMTIRTTGAPMESRNAIVQALAGVHKDIALDLKHLDEDLGANVLQERLLATLSGFFGVLALLLAALGLYGVMSYAVTRRRNEIGIRMALGAEPQAVVGLVLRHVALITGGRPDRRRGRRARHRPLH